MLRAAHVTFIESCGSWTYKRPRHYHIHFLVWCLPTTWYTRQKVLAFLETPVGWLLTRYPQVQADTIDDALAQAFNQLHALMPDLPLDDLCEDLTFAGNYVLLSGARMLEPACNTAWGDELTQDVWHDQCRMADLFSTGTLFFILQEREKKNLPLPSTLHDYVLQTHRAWIMLYPEAFTQQTLLAVDPLLPACIARINELYSTPEERTASLKDWLAGLTTERALLPLDLV